MKKTQAEYTARYKERHPERWLAANASHMKKWRAANRDKLKVYEAARRPKCPGDRMSPLEWGGILALFDHRCAYCRTSGRMTVDHVVPLSNGGEIGPGNIVPACKSCNSSKGNRPLEAWLDG